MELKREPDSRGLGPTIHESAGCRSRSLQVQSVWCAGTRGCQARGLA